MSCSYFNTIFFSCYWTFLQLSEAKYHDHYAFEELYVMRLNLSLKFSICLSQGETGAKVLSEKHLQKVNKYVFIGYNGDKMPWMKEQLSETVGINAELNQPISKIILKYLKYLKFEI